MREKTIQLTKHKPFAKGGNRLCFVHPEYVDRCIKVRRPDFTLEQLRASKGFPKNLRSLKSFDDNLEEYQVIERLECLHGDQIFQHICRCFGFVATDLGKGLSLELVRDDSGRIARSIKQHLIEEGASDTFFSALERLCEFWEEEAIPSRNLLLHNIVVPVDQNGMVKRLVVIDGLGSASLIPAHWLPKSVQRRQVLRKTARLRAGVTRLLDDISAGKHFSRVGVLLHDGTEPIGHSEE